MTAWHWGIRESREIDMSPLFSRFHGYFVDVFVVTDKDDLLRMTLSPTIACGDSDGGRSASQGADVGMLPCSSDIHPQFMHIPILRQIGNLLRPTLRPAIAEEKSAAVQRLAGQLVQIRMLPRSSHADRKLMNMVILAVIGDLFGTALWPIIADKWFHPHLLLCSLEARLFDT